MPDDIDDILKRLFPGVEKERYSSNDIRPRGMPRPGAGLAAARARDRFKGWYYDPTIGRNVRENPAELLDRLNRMAAARSDMRLDLEGERDAESALRRALSGVSGMPASSFSGAPTALLPTLFREASEEREERRANRMERERLEVIYDQLTKQRPHLKKLLPSKGEFVRVGARTASDLIEIAQRTSSERKEKKDLRHRDEVISFGMRMAKTDPMGAMRHLATHMPPYMTGPQAYQRAADTIKTQIDLQGELDKEIETRRVQRQKNLEASEKSSLQYRSSVASKIVKPLLAFAAPRPSPADASARALSLPQGQSEDPQQAAALQEALDKEIADDNKARAYELTSLFRGVLMQAGVDRDAFNQPFLGADRAMAAIEMAMQGVREYMEADQRAEDAAIEERVANLGMPGMGPAQERAAEEPGHYDWFTLNNLIELKEGEDGIPWTSREVDEMLSLTAKALAGYFDAYSQDLVRQYATPTASGRR